MGMYKHIYVYIIYNKQWHIPFKPMTMHMGDQVVSLRVTSFFVCAS